MRFNMSFDKVKQFFVNVAINAYDRQEEIISIDIIEKLLLKYCKKNNTVAVYKILTDNQNINVNVSDELGLTPIIIACKFNNIRMAKLLLDRGAIVNVKSKGGEMPIFVACKRKNKLLVRYLLEKDNNIINLQDEYGRTPLMIAVDDNNMDMIRCLMKYNPDCDIQDNRGRSPLMVACQNKNTYLTGLFLNGEDVFPKYSIADTLKIREKSQRDL